MPRRRLLSDAQRANLLALPTREAALIRHFTLTEDDLALVATRKHPGTKLGIEADPGLCHVFEFNRSKHPCFSDQALIKMRQAWQDAAIQAAVKAARGGRRSQA